MIKEAVLEYLIYNSKIYSIKESSTEVITKKDSIYEVIRIIDGVPLYLKEHLNRLRKSAWLIDSNIDKTDAELIDEIMKLIDLNKGYNLNMKILCTGDGRNLRDIYLYFIKSFYPPKAMYKEGIKTILYKSERKTPNAKTFNIKLREAIDEELKERNAFEALLVDQDNRITEGSRSNVFFVKGKILYTPPANKVLLGVTRSKIMELSKLNNIDIVEKDISPSDLKEYDGAFITGTSTGALPIKNIDEIEISSHKNDIIIKVMGIYERDIKNYIHESKGYIESKK